MVRMTPLLPAAARRSIMPGGDDSFGVEMTVVAQGIDSDVHVALDRSSAFRQAQVVPAERSKRCAFNGGLAEQGARLLQQAVKVPVGVEVGESTGESCDGVVWFPRNRGGFLYAASRLRAAVS